MKTTSVANFQNHILAKISATLLFFVIFSFSASAKGGGKLTFKDPALVSGTAGADGAVYRFYKVDKDIDALVTIKGRSNPLVYLVDIDMKTSGFDKAWQPQVGYNKGYAPGAADWWMEFDLAFIDSKTNVPVSIEEFDLSAIDIDGNGDRIREYVTFYGLTSYTVESTSILSISKLTELISGLLTPLGMRFDGPTLNFNNIDTSGTSVMTTAKYLNKQNFNIRTGAVATAANGAADRMYSLYFQEFKYQQPAQATLPVNLKNFDARVHSNKINLDWATAEEVNFSHFMIQRSTDGHDFVDASMIMSNAHALDYKYNYTETICQNAPPIVYFRLKMVDIDGSFKYSATRIVRLNRSAEEITVSTYPNPVSSELRITVPSVWQNKSVSYDLINLNGNIVKRKMSEHASQTETMQMSDLQAGIYVIRIKSGDSSAVQQVVKK